MKIQELSDAVLYKYCKDYGLNTRMWMRKFEGLIPEVYRRRLYKRRGFASIHEFSAKLAGMSREKTNRILQLARMLEDKPALRAVFEEGRSSYSKIVRVAYIATPENEAVWALKVQAFSQLAIELEVAKEREKSVRTHSSQPVKFTKMLFEMSVETEMKFRTLKQDLEEESGEALSYGEVLKKLFEKLEKKMEIGNKPKSIIKICPDCAEKKASTATTRQAPTMVKNLVMARQNENCAEQNCTHPPTELHHIKEYAKTHDHSPDNLAYLCKNHHSTAHAFDERVQKYRRE